MRKNPIALVRAFKSAFGKDDRSVSLILRINGAPTGLLGWDDIAAEVGLDDRIWVLPGTLTRDEALAVLAACDCLVSTHRAEGFGRNIAEALLLGVEVLATGFSGCMDFLAPNECVAWAAQPVRPGDYPFSEGLWWAEPDLADLVSKLRVVRARPESLPKRAKRARAIARRHAPKEVGKMLAARLTALFRYHVIG
jgi:glycosyltransferase involved in cell wall biosynthesis